MKKLSLLLLTLIFSVTFGIHAFAAVAPDTPLATDPGAEAIQVQEESAASADRVAPGPQEDGEQQPEELVEAEPEPARERFTIFGFTISNIITTALVAGVFVTGVVTKKMGKW